MGEIFDVGDFIFGVVMGIIAGICIGIYVGIVKWQEVAQNNCYRYDNKVYRVLEIQNETLEQKYNEEFNKISLICRQEK